MTEINTPDMPDVLAPEPHPPIAGNYADDDGSAIDEWFEAAPAGPQELGTVPAPAPAVIIPKETRIISRVIRVTVSATTNSDPILLLAADPNRKDLMVRVTGVGAAIPRPDQYQFLIGSDKTDIYNGAYLNGPCTTVSFGVEWRSDHHTGAVWAWWRISPDDVTPVDALFDVTVWSVTE